MDESKVKGWAAASLIIVVAKSVRESKTSSQFSAVAQCHVGPHSLTNQPKATQLKLLLLCPSCHQPLSLSSAKCGITGSWSLSQSSKLCNSSVLSDQFTCMHDKIQSKTSPKAPQNPLKMNSRYLPKCSSGTDPLWRLRFQRTRFITGLMTLPVPVDELYYFNFIFLSFFLVRFLIFCFWDSQGMRLSIEMIQLSLKQQYVLSGSKSYFCSLEMIIWAWVHILLFERLLPRFNYIIFLIACICLLLIS